MKKFYFLALVAAVAVTGCEETPTGGETTPKMISISPLLTRATETAFESGDKIGLTIVTGGGTYAENALLTFDGTAFTGEQEWYDDEAATADFTAYYPYAASGAPATFTVMADQSTGTSSSDLIIGKESGLTPREDAVGMTFKHVLSQIVIDLTNSTESTISAVVFKNLNLSADVDYAGPTVTAASTASTATAITAAAGSTVGRYVAILPPQEATVTLAVTMADANTYEQELQLTTFEQGKSYSVTAIVSDAGLIVKVNGEISGWEEGGSINPSVVTGTVTYQGCTYNTVTLSNGQTWMAEPLRYVPEGYTVSSDPTDNDAHIWYPYEVVDGAAIASTDPKLIAERGYLYDMFAIMGITAGKEGMTIANCKSFEGARGICPEGWHIPTRAEFLAVCGYSAKAVGETAIEDKTALLYDAAYKGSSIPIFNNAGLNFACSGFINKTYNSSRAEYNKLIIDSSVSTLTPLYGKPRMTYIATSTCYQPSGTEGAITNIQYFGLMSTFTSSYQEGRLTLGHVAVTSGMQVRCIKDAAQQE